MDREKLRKISIYNSLTKKKESFSPIKPGQVGIYACGLTTYDHSHIGHAMQAIFFDVIRNYLEFLSYQVTYVRNYTDVDDKIIKRALELGCSPRVLSEEMIEENRQEWAELGIRPANHEPKVSETIPQIIEMIEILIRKEAAYATADGDVYYRVRKKNDYGKLSNRQLEKLQSGSREIVKGQKEDELDFALWKQDSTEEASWSSPWGKGRPGWHIECSAMANLFLGKTFDIHGGGRDLVFPHHENEIAQSESANSCSYAHYWMHSGLLTLDKQKMSKSLGNTILIKDFLKKWPAEVLRLSFLFNHYRSNIDFSESVFKTCRTKCFYYYRSLSQLREFLTKEQLELDQGADAQACDLLTKEEHSFYQAMSDDFNTPAAMGLLHTLMKSINQRLSVKKKKPEQKEWLRQSAMLLHKWSNVFSILKNNPKHSIKELKEQVLGELKIDKADIELLIQKRNEARKLKNWAESDRIRNDLLAKGLILEDSDSQTLWTPAILLEE